MAYPGILGVVSLLDFMEDMTCTPKRISILLGQKWIRDSASRAGKYPWIYSARGGYNICMECCHMWEEIWTGRTGQAEKLFFSRSVLIGGHGYPWILGIPACSDGPQGHLVGASCCMNPFPVQLSMISLSIGWHWLLSLTKA